MTPTSGHELINTFYRHTYCTLNWHIFIYHSSGAWCYPEVPACWYHGAHGDRRQHKHSQGHSHQVWYHPPRRGLPLHRWQRVQQEDPQRERRGAVTSIKVFEVCSLTASVFFALCKYVLVKGLVTNVNKKTKWNKKNPPNGSMKYFFQIVLCLYMDI